MLSRFSSCPLHYKWLISFGVGGAPVQHMIFHEPVRKVFKNEMLMECYLDHLIELTSVQVEAVQCEIFTCTTRMNLSCASSSKGLQNYQHSTGSFHEATHTPK